MDRDAIQNVLVTASDLLEAGKPEESLACLDQLAQTHIDEDDRIEFAAIRAWALSELDRIDDALDALEPVLRDHPDAARLHAALGVVLSNDGNLEEACAELELAVTLDDEDDVAIANLGLVYERLREYERALELYDRALDLGVELDWLLQRKAITHAELGQYEDAKSTLLRYLSLAPEDAEQWVTLALFQAEDQDYAPAMASFQRAADLEPRSLSARLHYGVTALEAGYADIARRQLRFLREIAPHGAAARLLRALITEESSGPDRAAPLFFDAVRRVNPADAAEASFVYERAMDFFSRQQDRYKCEDLFELAYKANLCTVELCQAYRDVHGPPCEEVYWFSLLVEADYRPGLIEIPDRRGPRGLPFTRYWRNVQVVARDPDDAISEVQRLLCAHGATNVRIREFISQEQLHPTPVGIYEIEREAFVFSDAQAGSTEMDR